MKKVLLIVLFGIVLFIVFSANSSKPELRSLGQLLLPEIVTGREAKILFVGDMFFDRYIRQVGNSKGGDFIFSCISDFLKDSDLVVGNLEGPITDYPSVSMGAEADSPESLTFTFPLSTAKLLADNNIKIVNLGNNHIGNFGNAGTASTKKYLDEAGVDYFNNDKIYRTEIASTKISFISYNEFALPAEASVKVGGDSLAEVAQEISSEKANRQMVIVYAHWGDEYSDVPARTKNAAALFAKSGADLIIGSHPHIILPQENIGNTAVYYSLGNFIFDQYWNKDVSAGLVIEVNTKGKSLSLTEHRVSLNGDGRTCLATN